MITGADGFVAVLRPCFRGKDLYLLKLGSGPLRSRRFWHIVTDRPLVHTCSHKLYLVYTVYISILHYFEILWTCMITMILNVCLFGTPFVIRNQHLAETVFLQVVPQSHQIWVEHRHSWIVLTSGCQLAFSGSNPIFKPHWVWWYWPHELDGWMMLNANNNNESFVGPFALHFG
jgi:hypothetical protein